uniref:Uncharacterized protein n=1 Tax=Oryza sativa subsp. japonica TaxID=39947 RepID=Q6K6S2_ORYSJ|nr:hypothetical protein [Oryza sativa Japonica Group]
MATSSPHRPRQRASILHGDDSKQCSRAPPQAPRASRRLPPPRCSPATGAPSAGSIRRLVLTPEGQAKLDTPPPGHRCSDGVLEREEEGKKGKKRGGEDGQQQSCPMRTRSARGEAGVPRDWRCGSRALDNELAVALVLEDIAAMAINMGKDLAIGEGEDEEGE